MADVEATVKILKFNPFWTERMQHIHPVNQRGFIQINNPSILLPQMIPSPNDDSDTDD